MAGGGTGGHVVPGLHLLEHLRARGSAPADLLWFSAGRPVEDQALASLPERMPELSVERVVLHEPALQGALSWLRLLARAPVDVAHARGALARHGSQVLLALGGATSVPAVLAARTLGIPVILLEINAVAGKSTRSLAGLAERVVHAWPGSVPVAAAAGASRHVCSGPPLAPAFLARGPSEEESARARAALGFDPARPLLVVLGGSQGAAALNRFLLAHARELVQQGLQVLHQTGPGRASEAAPPVAGYRAVEYVRDVVQALTAATLVLCRGGASTLAEVAACRKPALVVPYPHHKDRHQEGNARALGAGVRIVHERDLGPPLVRELARLASREGDGERAAMSRALALALPMDGGERLGEELVQAAQRFAGKPF